MTEKTTKSLTNEEIARVFAMYWGCESINTFYKSRFKVCSYVISHLDESKLSLTPLSSITDEHAIEVFRLEYPDSNLASDKLINAVKNWLNEGNLNYKQDGYLKMKGYAVQLFFGPNHWANGKTAIELGIAINATTLKPA